MPRLDGTGPQGQGSLTGRGLGKCSNNKTKTAGGGFGFNRKKCDRLFLRRRNRGRFFDNQSNNND